MISIIIPNFNGKHHLESCLPSLYIQSHKDFEIIIIDNGSTDTSVDYIKKNYPDIKIIELGKNYGFAKAVNIGIKYTLQNKYNKYILLLNNDIECDKHFISELLKGFKNESIGSVGGKMLNYYKRNIIDDTGIQLKFKSPPRPRGHNTLDEHQYDNEEYIFGACGGAAIYKREVFDKIGKFDEDFVSYYEDVDFSFKLQYFGYKCLYNPKAICYHKRGGTASSIYRNYYCEKNLVALRIINYPFRILLFFSPIYFLVRIKYYFLSFHKQTIKESYWAIKGYIKGTLSIINHFKKRYKIQKNKNVSTKYILNLFNN